MVAELQSWAAREGLSDETVQVLVEHEFTSLNDVKLLNTTEVTENFQKPKLLSLKQCLALKKAIAKLLSEDCTAAPPSPAGPSGASPTGNPLPDDALQHGRGKDHPDLGPTTSRVAAVSLDESGGRF